MKKIYVIAFLLVGCMSTPKTSLEVPIDSNEKEYIVKDRYPEKAKDWVLDLQKFKKDNMVKGEHYFFGESGDVTDRILGCELAHLNAKKQIARQIAQLINEKIAYAQNGKLKADRDSVKPEAIGEYFSNEISGKSIGFLTGVKEEDRYWEERDYSKSGGRKRVYLCSVLVSIDDENMKEAVKRLAKKAPDMVEGPEAKATVKEALKNIDTEFKAFSEIE